MKRRKGKNMRRLRSNRKSNQNGQQAFLRNLALIIVVGFIFLFSLTTVSSAIQSKTHNVSMTLRQWTSHISTETFLSTLRMEMPLFGMFLQQEQIEAPRATKVLLETITSFSPEDPRSLIRRELPGLAYFDGQIVVAGQGVHYTDFPMESHALSIEQILRDQEAYLPDNPDENENQAPQQGELTTTDGRQVVFIYHTHNTESYLPHLPNAKTADDAFHPEVNITLVGQRLGQELERRGIGTQVDTTNFAEVLNARGLLYRDSYTASREIVQEAMATNSDIHFVFDLHRDAVARDKTTIEIDGQIYARTFFIIGARNRNYEKNMAFAEKFHDALEAKYPGLSRGIFIPELGNGEYNQSLFERNLLIEIGGVGNTLEESYRTAAALADVIADLYWESQDGSKE